MGLLRHAKQLVKELYPHAANFLGRGAVKVAESLQELGLPQSLSEKLLDTALESIPTTEQVIRGGKLALDMYGEFRNNSGLGFVTGAPPIGGIRQNIEYPGYYTKTGYSGLGGGFGRGSKHPNDIFEYGEAFPGNPAMEPENKILRGLDRKKPTVEEPAREAPPPPAKKTKAKAVSKKTAKAKAVSKKTAKEEMKPKKKAKSKKMIPAL